MDIFTFKSVPRHIFKLRLKGCLTGLLMLLLPSMIFAQSTPVSGTVTDENGLSLPGVSVSVKGTGSGASTDGNGKFKISAKDLNSTLVFSFIGYTKLEVELKGRSTLSVKMQPVANNLTEVVVVGYGAVKRKDLTGSVGTVNMQDFAKAPVKSFDDALAGRVAGVQVSSNDGQPGSNANIVIRGQGSVTQDNSPLYVVDGFPLESSNANSISPDDIESIDVLKDASATAIYGARGSNGVILITTKRGKNGPPQVNYNGYYGIQAIPKKVKLMDPYNFVKYVGEINPSIRDSVYLRNGVTLDDYKNVDGTDFQNLIYQKGVNQSHNLSVRGGNDATKFSISGNYDNQQGIIINSGFSRYQGRFALDQNVGKKLKVGINANYAYSESNGIPISATNFYASATTLYSVWGYRPTTGLSGRDANTDLINQFYDPNLTGNTSQDYRVNPLINIQNQLTKVKNTNFFANAYAEYAITKNLTFRTSDGITTNTAETDVFNNSQTQSGSTWNSSGVNGSVTFVPVTTWISENMLTYKATINNDHHFNILGDFSVQGNTSSLRGFSATQVPNEDLGIDGLDLSTTYTATSSSSRWNLASFVGRVNYDYKSKYLATASIRADGSSKFAPGQRWGYFPSASLAWRFSSEDFMKKASFISDAKLRLSYGASGNNRVSDFAYLPQLQLTNINYWYSANNASPAVGSVITSAGNYNLKWETNVQGNIGLDLSLFKDRVAFTVDLYRRTTNDLLLNASLPYATGIESSTGYENIGKLQNQGLEFSLTTTNINTPKFTWSSNFNVSFNRNKILALTQGQNAILSGSGTFFNTTYTSLFPYISAVGRPLGEMYGLIFDGVYQYSDFDKMPNGTYQLKANEPDNGTTRTSIKPGDIKYKDLNGDLTINNKDYTIIGHGLPSNTGGFSNNFRYKQFDLNVLLQWSYGNDIINANRIVFEGGVVSNPNLNQFASYENRWEPDNPSNTLFRAGGGGNAAYSSRVVEDGSYLKLRTVSLGYNLPAKLMTALKVHNVRVYASAQNIFTITGYSGQDPEVSARNSTLTPGFDYTAYPHSLTVVLGVNANF